MIDKVGVGIDLGTTYSRIAVWENSEENAIKKHSLKLFSKLVTYRDVDSNLGERRCADISTMLLKMKEFVEESLCKKMESAVITIPAYYDENQRQKIESIGSEVGFQVLKIIDETTASALVHNFSKLDYKNRYFLVFDLGCKILNVTIAEIFNKKIRIMARVKESIGGTNFDTTLHDYCIKKFKRLEDDDDDDDSTTFIAKLRNACEVAKITLSTSLETQMKIESLFENDDFEINRRKFESLNEEYFKKCLKTVDDCMEKVEEELGLNKPEIILVGGSTDIPKIKELLEKKFPEHTIHENQDESVALGAAILASRILEKKNKAIFDDSFID